MSSQKTVLNGLWASGPKMLITLFAFSALIRFVYMLFLGDSDIVSDSDAYYYLRNAKALCAGESFKNDTCLHAYQPPGYFYFLAFFLWLFSDNLDLVRCVQLLIGSFIPVLVFLISRGFGWSKAGLISASVIAVYPTMIHYSVSIYSETLFVFLLFTSLLLIQQSYLKSNLILKLSGGIFLGMAVLTRDAAMLVAIGSIAWFLILYGDFKKAVMSWLVVLLAVLVVIFPWTVRNYSIFKRVVPVSTNGGINLYIGNNPEANGTFQWRLPSGVKWNCSPPSGYPKGYYEYQANSTGMKQAMKFINDHPLKFAQLTVKRTWLFFGPPLNNLSFESPSIKAVRNYANFGFYSVLFIGSFVVAPFHFRKRRRELLLGLSTILMLSIPYLITFFAERYRLPIIPVMAIVSAITLKSIMDLRSLEFRFPRFTKTCPELKEGT